MCISQIKVLEELIIISMQIPYSENLPQSLALFNSLSQIKTSNMEIHMVLYMW